MLFQMCIHHHHHWCSATVYEMIAGPLISVHGRNGKPIYRACVRATLLKLGFFLGFAVSFPIFATSHTHTRGGVRDRPPVDWKDVRWGRAQQQRQKMYFAVDLETSIEFYSRLWRFQTPPGDLVATVITGTSPTTLSLSRFKFSFPLP